MFQIEEETTEFEEIEAQLKEDLLKRSRKKQIKKEENTTNLVGQRGHPMDHMFEKYSNLDLITSEIDQSPGLDKNVNSNFRGTTKN